MNQTPEAFAEALSSGETERVNRAIDEVEDMEPAARAAVFDECMDWCRDLSESDDGYQRQSVIRFATALYPRLELQTVGAESADEALPGEWTLDEIAIQRTRLLGLYLMALVDDDGRVRRAAVKGLKQLAVTLEMIEADDELQMMADELERIADEHDGSKQTHLDQAYENVAFHAAGSGSLLPEGLRDSLDQQE
jgi:hypothetical protein